MLKYAKDASGVALLPLWAAQEALKSAEYCRVLTEWEFEPAEGAGHIFALVPTMKAKVASVKAYSGYVRRHVEKTDVVRPPE